uniref:Uncharacterized protein n=1 Tax=Oryctolagus cuniculus TaxID=9986 RepID=A0A5F9CBE9_RABIT
MNHASQDTGSCELYEDRELCVVDSINDLNKRNLCPMCAVEGLVGFLAQGCLEKAKADGMCGCDGQRLGIRHGLTLEMLSIVGQFLLFFSEFLVVLWTGNTSRRLTAEGRDIDDLKKINKIVQLSSQKGHCH